MLNLSKSQKHFAIWLFLCFINVLNIIYTILYPYLASYMKLTDTSYTMKTFFNYFFLLYIGFTGASHLANLYLYFLDFKKTVLLNFFIIIFHNFAFGYCTNQVILIITIILAGSSGKVSQILCTLFFKEFYPKDAEWYIVKCYGMQFLGVAFHTILFSYVINPENKGREWAVEENGTVNYYYSSDVSTNLPKAMFINTIAHVIANTILLSIIPKSDVYVGQKVNKLKEKSIKDISVEISQQNIELNKSLSKSQLSDLSINSKENETELKEKIYKTRRMK